jgi:hypothetical protein
MTEEEMADRIAEVISKQYPQLDPGDLGWVAATIVSLRKQLLPILKESCDV